MCQGVPQRRERLGRDEFRVDEIVAEGLPIGVGVPTEVLTVPISSDQLCP